MTIVNPPVFDYLVAKDGTRIKTAIVALPTWNMNAVFTINVTLPVGITFSKIVGFGVSIINDSGTEVYPIPYTETALVNLVGVGIRRITSTTITLQLSTGSMMRSDAEFDGTAASRGILQIWYYE